MKYIKSFLLGLYLFIAIFSTICLLSLNEFGVTEFGDYSLIYIDKYSKNEEYERGDLAIVHKDEDIKAGDKAFVYNAYEKNVHPETHVIESVADEDAKIKTYYLDNKKAISSDYAIGKVDGSIKVPKMGAVLSAIQSKWGFLFVIVAPLLILFIYESFAFYDDYIKKDKVKVKKASKDIETKEDLEEETK